MAHYGLVQVFFLTVEPANIIMRVSVLFLLFNIMDDNDTQITES